MSVILPKKYPSPFSFDERETLKKWSKLSKSKKLLSPFQRKVLYESGLFDEIFLYRYSQIRDVLDEFSELLDISEEDRDISNKLRQKIIRDNSKLEVERVNSTFKSKFTLLELIEKGETAHIEFKQTLFYDVVGNAPGAPEAGILKTVIAFSNGQKNDGLLIVGVKDNNDIFGLESDFQTIPFVKKVNTNREKRDKAELWLRELLRENLKGYEDIVTQISIEFEKHDDKDIIRITVPKSTMPVYPSPVKKLKEYVISQAFYVKNGNRIEVLEAAARDRYISKYFNR